MAIKGDLLIRGGLIVDPSRNMETKGDVLILNGKIIDIPNDVIAEADKVIDATDSLVFPGLIDYHAHVFAGGTNIGFSADTSLLPQGVTCVVDQGSAGCANYDVFHRQVVQANTMKIFSNLHVAPAGLTSLPFHLENSNPAHYNLAAVTRIWKQYRGRLVGLKIRQSQEIVGELGLKPLAATIELAEKLGCPVTVHTTNPPGDIEELAGLLRQGDIFTHVYQGKNSYILDENNKIRPGIQAARKRGVVFDTADGRGHYLFSVIKGAFAEKFMPDILSTDVVKGSLFDQAVFGLPVILSKYLALGMSLLEVIRACTEIPAKFLGQQGKIGTLAPGACADVAIFKLKDMPLHMQDISGEVLKCGKRFVPQATILDGKVVYRSLEF